MYNLVFAEVEIRKDSGKKLIFEMTLNASLFSAEVTSEPEYLPTTTYY